MGRGRTGLSRDLRIAASRGVGGQAKPRGEVLRTAGISGVRSTSPLGLSPHQKRHRRVVVRLEIVIDRDLFPLVDVAEGAVGERLDAVNVASVRFEGMIVERAIAQADGDVLFVPM